MTKVFVCIILTPNLMSSQQNKSYQDSTAHELFSYQLRHDKLVLLKWLKLQLMETSCNCCISLVGTLNMRQCAPFPVSSHVWLSSGADWFHAIEAFSRCPKSQKWLAFEHFLSSVVHRHQKHYSIYITISTFTSVHP